MKLLCALLLFLTGCAAIDPATPTPYVIKKVEWHCDPAIKRYRVNYAEVGTSRVQQSMTVPGCRAALPLRRGHLYVLYVAALGADDEEIGHSQVIFVKGED